MTSDYRVNHLWLDISLRLMFMQFLEMFNYVKWFYCCTALCRIYCFIFNLTGSLIEYMGKMSTYAFINKLEIALG